MSTVRLEHPTLGAFKGIQGDGVEQFFGIQYATLKDRFAEPVVRTEYNGEVDATRHGATSHSAPNGFENEVGLFIQNEIPKPEENSHDLDCLNLGITVPAGASKGSSNKIPVFIWVHGGGFVVGASSWPHYDLGRLVKLGSDNGLPIIGVGINYRLGLPGFLTSEELNAAGYKGNNFLRDQRAAFQWVKSNIAGFGGDPDNVTVIGESAGAMAVTSHLFSQQPLFERAFATGGTCLVRPALPPAVHEGTYHQVSAALGLDGLSAADRIKALLTLPMDEITAKLPPSIQPNAIIDNDLFSTMPTYAAVMDPSLASVPAKKWLKALSVGDSAFDASVLYWLMSFLSPLSARFHTSARASLSAHPSAASSLLALYSFSPDSSEEHNFLQLLQFINDVSFTLGTVAFAKGFSRAAKKTNVFFFNEPNPWPGKFEGRATHVLDVVFLFQNYNEKLPVEQRKVARELGLDFVRFVRGEEAWREFVDEDGGRAVKVYGPLAGGGGSGGDNEKGGDGGEEGARTRVLMDALGGEGTGREKRIFEIADEVGWDVLAGVFVDFIIGKHLG